MPLKKYEIDLHEATILNSCFFLGRRGKVNIGLIGVGSIGTFLIEQLNKEEKLGDYRITAVFDGREKSAARLAELSNIHDITVYNDLTLFLDSSIDLVVECANVKVVKKYAEKIVCKKDLLLISVGALVDAKLYKQIETIAKCFNHNVYLPSGAIGGLDVLKSANILNGLESVTLVTRKPSDALAIDTVEQEMTLFEGTAKEAISRFPKNTNISIILSLAGFGAEQTDVKIIVDPLVTKNIHHLEVRGDFGKLSVTLENNPLPGNPKTSHLTALSILSTLHSLEETIIIS